MELELETPQHSLCSRDCNTHRDTTLGDKTLVMLSPSAIFHIVIMTIEYCDTSNWKKKRHKGKPSNVTSLFLSQAFLILGSVSCTAILYETLTMCPLYHHCSYVTLSTEAEDFCLTQHSIRRLQKQRKLSCRTEHTRRGKTGLWSLAPDQWDIHSLCWASKKISSRAMACTPKSLTVRCLK